MPGLVWLGPDGTVADVGDQATALLGISREQLVGRSLADGLSTADLVVPDEVAAWPSGVPVGDVRAVFARGRRGARTVRLSLQFRSGRQIFGIVEDLTHHVRTRHRLSNVRVKLEQLQALALQQQASAPLAHDLNNLLTALAGEAALALEGVARRDPVRGLQRIRALADRAADLAGRLLRRGSEAAEDVVCPRAELGSVLRALDPVLRCCLDPGHELRLEVAAVPCTVGLGEQEIERIVLNLLVNARDAMPESGAVTIGSGKLADGSVELVVADTGTGMPEHVEARAFEPLYSTKASGTGLGLAVVQRVVEEAGGRVELETREGEGTTVRIVLPASGGRRA